MPTRAKRSQQPDDIRRDEIELRAYLTWVNRGRPEGEPERDWLQAEEELRQEQAQGILARTQP